MLVFVSSKRTTPVQCLALAVLAAASKSWICDRALEASVLYCFAKGWERNMSHGKLSPMIVETSHVACFRQICLAHVSGSNAIDNLGRGSCFGALQASSWDVLVRMLLTDATGHAFFQLLREGTPTLGCSHWSGVGCVRQCAFTRESRVPIPCMRAWAYEPEAPRRFMWTQVFYARRHVAAF